MPKRKCVICNKSFSIKYKSLPTRTCSHNCGRKLSWKISRPRAKQTSLKCLQCNDIFIKPNSFLKQHPDTKFCSRNCCGLYHRKIDKYIILNCDYCNKEFQKRKDKLTKINFCSKRCMYNYRKGEELSAETINKIKAGMAKPEIKKKLKMLNSRKRKPLTEQHKTNYLRSRGEWTADQKARVSSKLTGKLPANMKGSGNYGNIKAGHYNINGVDYFFRSKWEANYALYLDYLKNNKQIEKWEYEVDVFIFHKIKFGTRSYRPDFKVTNNNKTFPTVQYHEVKGYMDTKSKTKLKRMKKYYPEIDIILIDKKQYNAIRKWAKFLKFY